MISSVLSARRLLVLLLLAMVVALVPATEIGRAHV